MYVSRPQPLLHPQGGAGDETTCAFSVRVRVRVRIRIRIRRYPGFSLTLKCNCAVCDMIMHQSNCWRKDRSMLLRFKCYKARGIQGRIQYTFKGGGVLRKWSHASTKGECMEERYTLNLHNALILLSSKIFIP